MAMKETTSSRLPRVDDHFIVEDSGVEVISGILHMVPPADEPHATSHFMLVRVLAEHLTDSYVGAVDMLTRTSVTSDWAALGEGGTVEIVRAPSASPRRCSRWSSSTSPR